MITRSFCTIIFSALVSLPAVSQPSFEKALRLFNNGDVQRSEPLFLEALKDDPRNAEALYYLGLLSVDKDYDKAIDYLEHAVNLNGEVAKYHLILGNVYGIKAQRAGILKKFSAATNCKNQYLTAICLDGKLTEARMNIIEYYLQAPGIIGGSVEKAVAQSDTIKKYDSYSGYLAEARIHEVLQEKAQEEQCYRKAISIDPKKVIAYKALWLLCMEASDGTKADAVFKNATAAVENKSDIYLQAGLYYVEKNNFIKARAMFEEALKNDPQNYSVCYQLGKLALLSGTDLYQGLAYFDHYIKSPRIKSAPGFEYAYWRMGMIYEKLGNTDSARMTYRKSLELNPDFDGAKKALEKLR